MKNTKILILILPLIYGLSLAHGLAQTPLSGEDDFCTAYKYAYNRTRNELLDEKIKSNQFLGMSTLPSIALDAKRREEETRREKSRPINIYCPTKPKTSLEYTVTEQGWLAGINDAKKDAN